MIVENLEYVIKQIMIEVFESIQWNLPNIKSWVYSHWTSVLINQGVHASELSFKRESTIYHSVCMILYYCF